MPKAKPDKVVVHRIELQGKERDLLEAYVGGTVVKNAVVPVAIGGGVAAATYISYKALKAAYGWGEDIVEDIKEAVDNGVAEPILGSPTYTTTNGKTLKNPFAGIPIVGGIWTAGSKAGNNTGDFLRNLF